MLTTGTSAALTHMVTALSAPAISTSDNKEAQSMLKLLESAIPEFVGGLLALLCAIVGAKIATKSGERQERTKSLQNAYADVFAGYYICMMESSDKNILSLVIAIERATLICSKRSAEIMKEAIFQLSKEPVDIQALGGIICQLRASAAKDLENHQRK